MSRIRPLLASSIALATSFLSAFALAEEPPKEGSESLAQVSAPPLIPAPVLDGEPVSSSGTDLSTRKPVNAVVPSEVSADGSRLKELEARLAADERRLHRLEEQGRILRHLRFGGFVQPQLLVQSFDANASPNSRNGVLPTGINSNDVVANPDGSTTNGSYFRMRRTRFKTTYETDDMRFFLQIDPFPAQGVGNGVGTVLRDASATGIAHWTRNVRTEFMAGVYMVPVALELQRTSDERPFIERSWAIRNIFPGERDVGAQAKTLAFDDRLVVDVGVVNGHKLGEPQFTVQPDLNKSKDVYGHAHFRLPIVTLGMSGYVGRGQIVDSQNLRFKQFDRWWVDYEVAAHRRFVKALGESSLTGELAIGQNMDTGVGYSFALPTIPQAFGNDVNDLHERMLVIRAEQELTHWGLVGYRYDFYTTDTSIANNARDTHAFVGVFRFGAHLRWMNELDYAIDNIHAPGTPPAARHVLAFSSVLQAAF